MQLVNVLALGSHSCHRAAWERDDDVHAYLMIRSMRSLSKYTKCERAETI